MSIGLSFRPPASAAQEPTPAPRCHTNTASPKATILYHEGAAGCTTFPYAGGLLDIAPDGGIQKAPQCGGLLNHSTSGTGKELAPLPSSLLIEVDTRPMQSRLADK